jgi:transglutaminase-like putative cysteine protease
MTETATNEAQSPALEPYLQETPACNYSHPAIQEIVHAVTDGCVDDTDQARRIFYYVRDSTRFALLGSGFDITASKTARMGYGDCGSKTNLHLALLRAAGIPARARGILAEFAALKGIVPGFLTAMSERFYPEDFHFWPECYLGGRWISCEALLDQPLYEGALRQGLFTQAQIPSIDWDGQADLILLGPWRVEDRGHRASIDEWMAEFQERMRTPAFVDWLMDRLLAPLCRRQSDRVRAARP